MNNEIFTKLQNDEYEFLDSIDLKPYLKNFANVWNIMNQIQKDHGKNYYEGLIFNCINEDEFMDYLKKRYGNKIYFTESIINYLHLNRED